MTQGAGSRSSISFIAESTYGTTPDTPAMTELRNTGNTLKLEKEAFTSNEIRSDGQITDMRHGVKRVQGDISFELSYGAFDDWLAAAMLSDWSSDVLKAGTTEKSFTVEESFADISEYFQYTGCMINQFDLSIQPNAMVTGSFGIVGKNKTIASSALDASVTASPTHPPFDGFTGSITEGGSVALVTELSLSLNNNLSPSFVLGSDTSENVIKGQRNLTGQAMFFFEDEVKLNKFINETETSISVTLQGASGGDLTILLPRIKYTAAGVDVQSANEGLLIPMPFQALRDSTEETNVKFTRVAA